MVKNILLFLLWTTSVYYGECSSHEKPKRGKLQKPHPYTISFFTFPKGVASELLKPKRESKRDNQDLSNHKTIKQAVKKTSSKEDKEFPITTHVSKEPKSSLKDSRTKKTIEQKTQRESSKKAKSALVAKEASALDKAGKTTEEQPDSERRKAQPLKPWSLTPTHNKIDFSKYHAKPYEENESYQEGSIKHPSHTMYPQCHHCPRNSSYEDCASKTTLKKCSNGLNNICFTKSFYSNSRGVIYEMGCANHAQCQKAKAKPCRGAGKKCFVCCQFDECNAQEHNYFKSSQDDDDDTLGYSAFSGETISVSQSGFLVFGLQFVGFLMT